MLNLSDRSLMALEILKSMLESPFYFNEKQREIGIEPEFAAREAVMFADNLQKALDKQQIGSITLTNDNGDIVTLSTEALSEVKRLVGEGDQAEAIRHVRSSSGSSQKSAKELVDKLANE